MTDTPVLILGARSDIGRAVAHAFAARGHDIQLAARKADTLAADRDDIALRYNVAVSLHECDALDIAGHAAFVADLPSLPGIAVCAIGLMGDQAADTANPAQASTVLRSNFEGPASLLGHLANAMAARGSGTLIGISSVAGERGRASNYIYGAAKAGFSAFLSGLRNRLAGQGVHVITVLPGFVETRMTAGMDLPGALTAAPEEVAGAILKAQDKGRNVIYTRSVWRVIMGIIRAIPETIFKRLKL